MRIGVVSDTHLDARKSSGGWRSLMGKGTTSVEGLIERLEPVFADVEMVIHAGDITSQPVLDGLGRFGTVEAVQGNMEGADMKSLPYEKVLEVKGFRIGVVHGWGAPRGIQHRIRKRFAEVNAIVYGHTHEPFNKVIDGILFFNPGSPTDNFFAPYKSVGILEISRTIEGEIIRL